MIPPQLPPAGADPEPQFAEFEDGSRRRLDPRRPISQLPNMVSILALACGLTAARLAVLGLVWPVLLLLLAAAVLDALDGRLARLLDATSEMGAQLDSLCDAISFGVTPAFVTYYLVVAQSGTRFDALAWAAAMIYVGAIVLRLARFNVLLESPNRLPIDKEFFVGVPAPAAMGLALAPVLVRQGFGPGWWSHPATISFWLILVAFLAFSRLPTFTFKTVRLTNQQVPLVLFVGLIVVVGLFTFFYYTLLLVLLVYLIHIPYACRRHRWLLKHPDAWEAAGAERRVMRQLQRQESRGQRQESRGHRQGAGGLLSRGRKRRFYQRRPGRWRPRV